MKKHVIWAIVVILAAAGAFFVGKNGVETTLRDVQAQLEKLEAEKALKPTFAGAEKHEITLEEAKKLVQSHTKKIKAGEIHGGAFNRAIIDKILAQPGCESLRFYYAVSENGKPTIILVGVDSKGHDMTKMSIAEKSYPCPPYCDGASEILR